VTNCNLVAIAMTLLAGGASAAAPGETQALPLEVVVSLPGEGAASGASGRIKIDAAQTGGTYALIERLSTPIEGPASHNHSNVIEAWYVLEGTINFQSRDAQQRADAGTFVLAPRGVDHRFWADAGTRASYLMLISPGNFARYFQERREVPGFDSSKSMSQQSAEVQRAMDGIALKYGGGPSERVSDAPIIFTKPGAGSARRQVLATEPMTDGAYQFIVGTHDGTSANEKIDPHRDQGWYVLSGRLTFVAAGKTIAAPRGTFVFVPGGVKYRILGEGTEVVRYVKIISRVSRR
jgi:mannose-6-phosphate isomerase-like protein (cupin superfamily)